LVLFLSLHFLLLQNDIDDFEFNQDISYEKEIRSPGWLRLEKKLNEKK